MQRIHTNGQFKSRRVAKTLRHVKKKFNKDQLRATVVSEAIK